MSASLVGSEMCIRDRRFVSPDAPAGFLRRGSFDPGFFNTGTRSDTFFAVSYTHLTLPTICSV
eukprot:779356-Alexandrium_andersonii.AAC.1